jgi:hypothetical protein
MSKLKFADSRSLMVVALLSGAAVAQPSPAPAPTSGQTAATAGKDPRQCLVILETLKGVGLRISDGQLVAETVVTGLRKRLGAEAVIYAGVKDNAAAMKKLLGKGIETVVQDDQIAFATAAEASAPWRVQASFGRKKGREVITVRCLQKGKDKPVDEQNYSGKRFSEAQDALIAGLPTFCSPLVAVATEAIPIEGATPGLPPGVRKPPDKLTPWTIPPRRE